MAGDKSNILEQLNLLVQKCVIHKKAFLGQPKISEKEKKKRLKQRLFDTLFSNLTGPHSHGLHSNGVSQQYGANEVKELLGKIYDLRADGHIDRANRLHSLIDNYVSKGELEEKGRVLRVLLTLAHTLPESQPSEATIGSNVFKPPTVFMNKELPALLPPGPRIYGDSVLPNNSTYFMHFPAEVFSVKGVGPADQSDLISVNASLLQQKPGTSLPFIFNTNISKGERYSRRNEVSLFGALTHSHSSGLSMTLELPSLSDNPEFNGLHIPKLAQSPQDEGYASSTLTGTCSVESLRSDDSGHVTLDTLLHEALSGEAPPKYLAWETVGRPKFVKEKPYVTEAGRAAFDVMYLHRCATLRLLDPSVPEPGPRKLSMTSLVRDVINLLIGVPSTSFHYDNESEEFCVGTCLCLSGLSMAAGQQLCAPLLEGATHYARLVDFSRPIAPDSFHYRGLVFQAFTEGIRRYIQYYRGYVLSLSPRLTLLQLSATLRPALTQLRFLAQLCGCALQSRDQPAALRDGCFPTGVALLSYLYEECLDSADSHHYPMLLSIFNSAVKPFVVFISEWVFHGMHRDLYREFFIRVDYDYLHRKDETYWTRGYRLTKDAQLAAQGDVTEEHVRACVPHFLRDLVHEIHVCGKSINLLRAMAPQHFLLSVTHDIPRVRLMYSELDIRVQQRTCRAYLSRMQARARTLTRTREQMRARAEQAKRELILRAREAASEHMRVAREKKRERKEQADAKKKELLAEIQSQMNANLRRRAAADEAEREEDAARMNNVTRQELVEAKVEEELERQAREELVAYYASLSEDAARREQRALWRVSRLKLAPDRTAFLQLDEQQLLNELEENPIYESVEQETTDTPEVQEDNSTKDLPSWAQKGLQTAGAAFGLNPENTEALPKWAQSNDAKPVIEVTDAGEDTLDSGGATKSHPSHSTIQGVLKMSDNISEDKENKKSDVLLASDAPHVSQTSKQGLLRVDGVSDVISHVTSRSDYVTVKDLAHAQELHEKHTGVKITQPKQHPSASSIQTYMYDTKTEKEMKTSGDNVNETNTKDTSPDIEEEVQKLLQIKKASHIKSATVKKEAKSHIKLSATMHATTESNVEDTYKPTVKTSAVGGITTESESQDTFTPHIKTVQGQSATSESAQSEIVKPHIKTTEGKGATFESNEETEIHKLKKSVQGSHVSEESKEEIQTFRLKTNPDKHVKRESSPKKVKVFKPSVFGHVSQLSAQAEYDILVPKLRRVMEQHSSMESDWRNYQVKACRRKVKGQEVNKQSDEVDSSEIPRIRNTTGQHVSQESELIDTDKQRLERFRKQNIHGHATDSSAQRLLYGEHYGTGQMFADVTIVEDMSDVPRTGDFKLETSTELLAFEDDFTLLTLEPKLDLLVGHVVSDMGGEMALRTGEEDVSAHAYSSLTSLVHRSVALPILTQISLVNESLLNYFLAELEIGRLFEGLRRYMLMEDGEFSQSLSDQLCQKLATGPSVHEMFNPLYLNGVLKAALQSSLRGNLDNPELTFVVHKLPAVLNANAVSALSCIELTQRVDWPANLVVSEACVRTYSHVFTFMLQLKRQVWALRDIWYRLKRDSTIHKASNSTQFRQLQLYKHEMQHVIKVLQGYIASQVLEVTWHEFQAQLRDNVTSLDQLIAAHARYLLTCQARCLLNPKMAKVMKVIENVFSLILTFHAQLCSAAWRRDDVTGHVTHPHFTSMCRTYKSFHEYSVFLFKVVSLLAARGYQPHLKELVLRLNFNGHYHKQRA